MATSNSTDGSKWFGVYRVFDTPNSRGNSYIHVHTLTVPFSVEKKATGNFPVARAVAILKAFSANMISLNSNQCHNNGSSYESTTITRKLKSESGVRNETVREERKRYRYRSYAQGTNNCLAHPLDRFLLLVGWCTPELVLGKAWFWHFAADGRLKTQILSVHRPLTTRTWGWYRTVL